MDSGRRGRRPLRSKTARTEHLDRQVRSVVGLALLAAIGMNRARDAGRRQSYDEGRRQGCIRVSEDASTVEVPSES